MKMRPDVACGLRYGAIASGIVSVIPLLAWALSDAPLDEVALVGGITMSLWGSLAFVAGFCSYRDPAAACDNAEEPPGVSGFKHWAYRFVAGFLLSYLASFVVGSILFVLMLVCMGLFEATIFRGSDQRIFFLKLMSGGMLGSYVGSLTACWLGAMLSPGGNVLRPVAKCAALSAILGMLFGGFVGLIAGLMHPALGSEDKFFILAGTAGGLAGIGAVLTLGRRFWRRRVV